MGRLRRYLCCCFDTEGRKANSSTPNEPDARSQAGEVSVEDVVEVEKAPINIDQYAAADKLIEEQVLELMRLQPQRLGPFFVECIGEELDSYCSGPIYGELLQAILNGNGARASEVSSQIALTCYEAARAKTAMAESAASVSPTTQIDSAKGAISDKLSETDVPVPLDDELGLGVATEVEGFAVGVNTSPSGAADEREVIEAEGLELAVSPSPELQDDFHSDLDEEIVCLDFPALDDLLDVSFKSPRGEFHNDFGRYQPDQERTAEFPGTRNTEHLGDLPLFRPSVTSPPCNAPLLSAADSAAQPAEQLVQAEGSVTPSTGLNIEATECSTQVVEGVVEAAANSPKVVDDTESFCLTLVNDRPAAVSEPGPDRNSTAQNLAQQIPSQKTVVEDAALQDNTAATEEGNERSPAPERPSKTETNGQVEPRLTTSPAHEPTPPVQSQHHTMRVGFLLPLSEAESKMSPASSTQEVAASAAAVNEEKGGTELIADEVLSEPRPQVVLGEMKISPPSSNVETILSDDGDAVYEKLVNETILDLVDELENEEVETRDLTLYGAAFSS